MPPLRSSSLVGKSGLPPALQAAMSSLHITEEEPAPPLSKAFQKRCLSAFKKAYKRGELLQIGKGGQAAVYAFSHEGKDLAVKLIGPMPLHRSDAREAYISADLPMHPHLVRTYFTNDIILPTMAYSEELEAYSCIVMQNIPGKDLYTALSSQGIRSCFAQMHIEHLRRFMRNPREMHRRDAEALLEVERSIKDLRHFIREIASAIEAYHRMDIIHRDIKPTNILLTSDRHWVLIDNGLVRFMNTDNGFQGGLPRRPGRPLTACGSLHYESPEAVSGYYDLSADIWSFGATCYKIVTGSSPFVSEIERGGIRGKRLFETELRRRKHHESVPLPLYLPPECADLLSRCLSREKRTRLNITDILRHPFLQKSVSALMTSYRQHLRSASCYSLWDIEERNIHKVLVKDSKVGSYSCKKLQRLA